MAAARNPPDPKAAPGRAPRRLSEPKIDRAVPDEVEVPADGRAAGPAASRVHREVAARERVPEAVGSASIVSAAAAHELATLEFRRR